MKTYMTLAIVVAVAMMLVASAAVATEDAIDVTALTQPLYPVIIIAFISVLVLIPSDVFLIRRTTMKYSR